MLLQTWSEAQTWISWIFPISLISLNYDFFSFHNYELFSRNCVLFFFLTTANYRAVQLFISLLWDKTTWLRFYYFIFLKLVIVLFSRNRISFLRNLLEYFTFGIIFSLNRKWLYYRAIFNRTIESWYHVIGTFLSRNWKLRFFSKRVIVSYFDAKFFSKLQLNITELQFFMVIVSNSRNCGGFFISYLQDVR